MEHLHIESITPTGTRHLAEITLFDQVTIDALERQRDLHGVRWFPPDTNPYAMRDGWITVSDEHAGHEGFIDEVTAERWLREGLSFHLSGMSSSISNPDIQRVLVMSYAELMALDDSIDQDCPTITGILGLMRAWHERPEVVTVRIIAW